MLYGEGGDEIRGGGVAGSSTVDKPDRAIADGSSARPFLKGR